MKKVVIGLGILAAGLVTLTASADALTCTSEFYRGNGKGKPWTQGRANARANWVDRVDGAIGWPWSAWAKAKIKDETCKWTGHTNSCVSKAYPCR